jgi:hypothetical protein
MERGTEAQRPRLPGCSARRRHSRCLHRPARRGGREEEGEAGREEGAADRQLLPAAAAEPDSPLSARTRKRFPSDPPTPPPPLIRPAPPTPARRSRPRLRPGLAPANGKSAFQGSCKSKKRPSAAQTEPAGSATGVQCRIHRSRRNLRTGRECGPGVSTCQATGGHPWPSRIAPSDRPCSGYSSLPRPPFVQSPRHSAWTKPCFISTSNPSFTQYLLFEYPTPD